MSEIIEITDISAPELDSYARLTENQLKNKKNPADGMFIAESRTVVTLALDAEYEPISLLVEKNMISTQARDIISRCGDVPIYTAEKALLEGLTGFSLSRGIFAVMKRKPLPDMKTVCKDARRIAVLENIMDATNVGAIIRSAAALGIDAVLLTPSCNDPLNRRAARVSMGTVFQIPWTYIDGTMEQWYNDGQQRLRRMGFSTAAMALSKSSVSVDDPKLKASDKLAVILGTEGTGLSDETVNDADYVVKIPMFHGVDSLNVAAASAVAFWELCKDAT